MWATLSPEWNRFQISRTTVTLIASHLFCIPVTREFLAAAGAREVSKYASSPPSIHFLSYFKSVPSLIFTRGSFNYALDQGHSVVLVPGGMKEMRESLSTMDDIVVCKSHKGFVKMAITHGVDLVPLFSFGETKVHTSSPTLPFCTPSTPHGINIDTEIVVGWCIPRAPKILLEKSGNSLSLICGSLGFARTSPSTSDHHCRPCYQSHSE